MALSDMLHVTEWMILTVPDHSRSYIDFDLEGIGSGEEWEARRRDADAAAVVEGLLSAAQIFVYASLRGLPRNAKVFGILLERVRRALDRPAARSLCEIWNEQGNANVLLWVLVMACSVTGDRGWYSERLGEVLNEMGHETRLDMAMVLRHVAWVDGYLDNVVTEIWEKAMDWRRPSFIADEDLARSIDADSILGSMWDFDVAEQNVEGALG